MAGPVEGQKRGDAVAVDRCLAAHAELVAVVDDAFGLNAPRDIVSAELVREKIINNGGKNGWHFLLN